MRTATSLCLGALLLGAAACTDSPVSVPAAPNLACEEDGPGTVGSGNLVCTTTTTTSDSTVVAKS